MAPRTVVPAVATTARHGRPSAFRDLKRSAKASRQRPPSAATGSVWSASSASPITFAALLMWSYDAGPQTKRLGLIGNIAISLMVGAVIVYGAAAVSLANTEIVIYAAIVAFFANLAREIIKDCEDMESDEGRNTLPMRIGLMNARSVAYVFILASMVTLGLAHYIGPLEYHQIVFHAPAIFILFSLNGPLFHGDDHKAQQNVRVGMLLGLIAFAVQVSVL